jgi:hypothetical protein
MNEIKVKQKLELMSDTQLKLHKRKLELDAVRLPGGAKFLNVMFGLVTGQVVRFGLKKLSFGILKHAFFTPSNIEDNNKGLDTGILRELHELFDDHSRAALEESRREAKARRKANNAASWIGFVGGNVSTTAIVTTHLNKRLRNRKIKELGFVEMEEERRAVKAQAKEEGVKTGMVM